LELKYNIKFKIYIIQSDKTLYFIILYYTVIPATCFDPTFRAIFRLVFGRAERFADLCVLVMKQDVCSDVLYSPGNRFQFLYSRLQLSVCFLSFAKRIARQELHCFRIAYIIQNHISTSRDAICDLNTPFEVLSCISLDAVNK